MTHPAALHPAPSAGRVERYDTIIIGAGQAGLAVGHHLAARDADFVTPTSSIDILPTCLALMGVPHVNTAMGRDALLPRPPERSFAFLSNGLIQDDWFWRSERDGRTGLHRYASDEPEKDWRELDPERYQRMSTTHGALREWALWRLHEGRALLERAPAGGDGAH
jgi:arylsulfatase A-like enzyme